MRVPYFSYVAADWGLERVFGRVVRSGPFAGLRYGSEAHWGPNVPKILGTYEKELHAAIRAAVAQQPAAVIDVGAAEGYYAVGLARLLPAARVLAFEADLVSRRLLAEMAARNGVGERLEVGGRCDLALFRQALESEPGALVVMDIEGGERELLDPAACPGLRAAPILVELHEEPDATLGEVLTARFRESHDVQRIVQAVRTPRDLPWPAPRLFHRLLLRAMNERRAYPMSWLWLTPKIAPVG